MPKRNITSSIREGFDYQDWWGLKFCGDWLINPSLYRRVCFETTPEEAGEGRFNLDDIVLIDGKNSYHLFQIKYRQHAGDIWTWNQLLSSKPKGLSLLQKCAGSLEKLGSSKIGRASLITNGVSGEEITVFLEDKKIRSEKIKNQDPDLYNQILGQLGSEEKLIKFFSLFEFSFGEADLTALEQEVREKFYSDLRATKSGVNNFINQIHKECRREYTRQLTIEYLKEWCEFDDPKPLREDFFIPEDFKFFDEQVHKKILKDLSDAGGGIKVIFGKPGTGKSVYLSKLHQILSEEKYISIRHHYHLSPEDKNPQERLNAARVVEALKAQFKDHSEELGTLANQNSKDISPREFITALASHLHSKNKAFVLIIDGLDHVIRNADVEELKKFLDSVCFPQPGLWIILGMQPNVSQYLPGIILNKCPAKTWIEMSGLSRRAIDEIVTDNRINLHLPENEDIFSSVLNQIFKVTQGNPLHLRYLLNELKFRHGSDLITEYQIENIVPYGGDIENYYKALWTQLTDKAKAILFSVACVNFIFKRRPLLECVSSFETSPSDLSQAFKSIQHLVKEDRKSRISIYHNSFQVFLLKQPDFETQKVVLKKAIRDWLKVCPYETLKWAELRKIEYELGNELPLMEIDRQWLLKAITHPRNLYQIGTQLRLAGEAAFKKDDFPKTLFYSSLPNLFFKCNRVCGRRV